MLSPDLMREWWLRLPSRGTVALGPDEQNWAVIESALATSSLGIEPDTGSFAARNDRGVRVHIEGWLVSRDTRERVGSLKRTFDTNQCRAIHDDFRIGAHFQNRGIGRRMLDSSTALYRAIGIRSVLLEASEVGRYTWAAAGFDFDSPQARDAVVDSVSQMAERLGFDLEDLEIEHAWELAALSAEITVGEALEAEDPELKQFSELYGLDPYQRIRLGKALLLSGDCPSWSGQMELDDRNLGYDRLKTYIAT